MFVDRQDAGRRLGQRLQHLRGEDLVILGLPRGGVPVAAEVALALGAPLDVVMVRKLGVPLQPELAMGAVGEGGVRVVAPETVRRAGVTDDELAGVESRERAELERRAQRFRGDRTRLSLVGRTAVVVDDGIATGSTARAACQVVRDQGATRVVLAVPVASFDWSRELHDAADELIALVTPRLLRAIGVWYTDFSQCTDEEVVACLRRVGGRSAPVVDAVNDPPVRDMDVEVDAGAVALSCCLALPQSAIGFVVFAQRSASSRHSPSSRFVATVLNRAELGTVLVDLLTCEEREQTTVLDIRMLAERLVATTRWLRARPEAGGQHIGYLGAGVGAAAALWAAAEPEAQISAVVSVGGRADLAAPRMADVAAPTLLIAGDHDEELLYLNRQAQGGLRCDNDLVVVSGASDLIAELGSRDTVAELARDWFVWHLATQPAVGGCCTG